MSERQRANPGEGAFVPGAGTGEGARTSAAPCQQPGCSGQYAPDGYCDQCGSKAAARPPSQRNPAPSVGAPPAAGTVPGAGGPGAAAPTGWPAGASCQQPGCAGHYAPDGYCDQCGSKAAAPPASVPGPARPTSGPPAAGGGLPGAPVSPPLPGDPSVPTGAMTGGWRPTGATAGFSGRTGAGLGGASGTGTRSSRSRATARGGLGAGLVEVPPVPLRDPTTAVMADPKVSESRRYCGKCDQPVGRSRDGQPGRAEGFCPQCGTEFSFLPGLSAGEVVDNRYEILGCLAYGGLGWIYLARDRHVSEGGADRWVVLKGLINTGDPDAMESAVAERRFLVEVDHPNIVKIHDFARHPDPKTGELIGYIVMEYVGGQSLKDLALDHRDAAGQRAPLPLPQVLAYGLEVLPALGYLHGRGLVFCDFKPDNVIQAEEQLKLIDLGAVRRLDDPDGAIYGTPGYQAPDVATRGPSVESDLYTVGRALAVLSFTFTGFSSRYATSLPSPAEIPLFAQEPSFHRLLVRATHPEPERRFASAAEMADQLLGVLREVLSAADGIPRPSMSTLFTAERQPFGTGAGDVSTSPAAAGGARLDGREVVAALPLPLVDPADPAAAFLATVDAAAPAEAIQAMRQAPARTVEVAYRVIRALIETGDVPAAQAELRRLDTPDADWRHGWHRGLLGLAAGAPREALGAFEAVAAALPGEPAALLAEAVAAELSGHTDLALARYARVWRVDHGYVSAAFGVSRLLLAARDRQGAIAVLDEVPDSSSRHTRAQIAAIRARLDRTAGAWAETDLVDAAARLEKLGLDTGTHAQLSVEVFVAALEWLGVPADAAPRSTPGRPPRQASGTVLGRRLVERELRLGLEAGYRALASLERTPLARYALVDRANAVRPRTLV
ncbi:serine/threonine-protein kinase PknG [Actinocatenispora thailandica]|uniref:non-specific serine/threonine protein kinase n=1 Tax=Actinocatenispora thailandica TaxID=227318 RepID=A0A7R7DML4_9ACTN|nr:serine/threonine-protein kinase [Actinocatenispora thailandica]BCJ34455.1 serine/threonine-protein kinase PknG [Actinocatenispora thailandica]